MMKKLFAASTASGLIALTANAAVVTLTPYTGPGDWVSSPDLQTVNALSVTNGGAGVLGSRNLEQSFTLATSMTVGSIYLTITAYDPSINYNIRFFQMGGSGANSTTLNDWNLASGSFTGTQVGSTISSFTGGSSVTGNQVLRIDLAPAEQVALAAGQYMITVTDLSNTTAAFTWLHTNTGSNLYADGRYYISTFAPSGLSTSELNNMAVRDFGLALVAVPEPSSSAALIGGLGMLSIIRRRRV